MTLANFNRQLMRSVARNVTTVHLFWMERETTRSVAKFVLKVQTRADMLDTEHASVWRITFEGIDLTNVKSVHNQEWFVQMTSYLYNLDIIGNGRMKHFKNTLNSLKICKHLTIPTWFKRPYSWALFRTYINVPKVTNVATTKKLWEEIVIRVTKVSCAWNAKRATTIS